MNSTRLSRGIGLMLVLSLLSACGSSGSFGSFGSGLNPFRSKKTAGVVLAPRGGYGAQAVDDRTLVDQVTFLKLEKTTDGAILHATGLPPTQGWWEGALVSTTDMEPEDGVLKLQFRIAPPWQAPRVSTVPSREVQVGLFLSPQKLERIRRIEVEAAHNSRSLRN